MKAKQKFLLTATGITFFLILTCMVIALAQFQKEASSILPDEIVYSCGEEWHMVSLDSAEADKLEPEGYGELLKELEAALEAEKYQVTNLPFEGSGEASALLAFHAFLPSDCAGRTVNVSSANAKILAILNGSLIYQYGFSGEEVSGDSQHLLDIPSALGAGEIWIALLPSGPNAAPALNSVILNAPNTVVVGVLGNGITDIGCCLLIIIMALIMLMLAVIRKYTNQPSRGELFLGLAGICAGSYCFIGTRTLDLFYNIQAPYVVQEYLVLIIPLLLALYLVQNLHTVFPCRFHILLLLANANGILQIILQLLSIRILHDMEFITAIVIGVICVTAIVSLLQFDRKSRHHRAIPSVLALLILLAGDISTVIISSLYDGSME